MEIANPCTCCKDDRSEKKLPLRELKKLPLLTEHEGLAVFVCEFCDGPAYSLATQAE